MSDRMLEVSFSFTDEFGQKSEIDKTLTQDTLEFGSQFEILVSEFKLFLVAAGFDPILVDKVGINE